MADKLKKILQKTVIRPLYRFLMRRLAVRNNVFYGENLSVGRRSTIMAPSRLQIGNNVRIGMDTWIAVDGVIEDGVLISSYVGIVGRHDHILEFPGQSPVDAPWIYDDGYTTDKRHSVHIERNVWIGYNAIILSGIRIGQGAIVAAGSVVTKDVDPFSIVAGNPAKKIGLVFSEEKLIEFKDIHCLKRG